MKNENKLLSVVIKNNNEITYEQENKFPFYLALFDEEKDEVLTNTILRVEANVIDEELEKAFAGKKMLVLN